LLISIGLCCFLHSGLKAQKTVLQFDPKLRLFSHSPVNWLSSSINTKPEAALKNLAIQPKAWCYADLAFFCKLEVKMEKAARFPIKFRLGDVGYVDRLEGKR
jgi:hypothetical protein